MGEFIVVSKDALMDTIKKHSYPVRYGKNDLEEGMTVTGIAQAIDELPTAFDLESVIMEIEGISKDMQSEANDLASIGDYGCATEFEGMARAYKDCVRILKSAMDAKKEKDGVLKGAIGGVLERSVPSEEPDAEDAMER